MSDGRTIKIKRRRVSKNHDGLYYVFEVSDNGVGWTRLGRGYPHSTSAYAKLGRIVSREAAY